MNTELSPPRLTFQEQDVHVAQGEASGLFRAALEMPFDDGSSSSAPTQVLGGQLPATFPAMERTGDFIGRYRLIEELGEGGFGIVWQVEQFEPIRRKVALKVIKPGRDSREIIARFEAERQALALMDHPNIAAVLDAGTSESGRPYFVMELVHGIAITEYCDSKRLTIRQRLELFIPVCQAVQHAHQKAILHRDLKPSNILVTEVDGKPVPKVIDFGIAKALEVGHEKILQATLACTQEGMVVGTPQYMSPEQAGTTQDLDTRSDIYTLGVILYELLTGNTPLTRESMGEVALDEVLRLIRESDPARPSSRVVPITDVVRQSSAARGMEPGQLNRVLRGDLDWITLRALEKERERRYGSAAALAQDLERYLNLQPVEAGPPSTWYRLRKLARRNRVAFAASAAILMTLLAGIAGSTWQAIRATKAETQAKTQAERATQAEGLAMNRFRQVTTEKARADSEAEIAKAVNSFLRNDLLAQAGSRAQANTMIIPNPDLTVKEALLLAAERIKGRFRSQPLVEAAIQKTIGDTYHDLGVPDSAVLHLRRAIQLQTQYLGAEDPETLASRNALGLVLEQQGQYVEAEKEHRAVLAIQERVLGAENRETLGSRSNAAMALIGQQKFAQAELEYRALIGVMVRVLGESDTYTLSSRGNLAIAMESQGKLEEAEREHRTVLAATERVRGPEHPDTLNSRHNIAVLLDQQHRYAEAEQENRAVLAIRERVLGPEHPDTLKSRYNLALALEHQSKDAEAEKEFRAVRTIQERTGLPAGLQRSAAIRKTDNGPNPGPDPFANPAPPRQEIDPFALPPPSNRDAKSGADLSAQLVPIQHETDPYAKPSPLTGTAEPTRLQAEPPAQMVDALMGKWSHSILWIDGKQRTLIFQASRDNQGAANFTFLQQYWSYRPVFTEMLMNGSEIEIRFKLVLYANAFDVSPYTLKYLLKLENGNWTGRLFESWESEPRTVELTKLPN